MPSGTLPHPPFADAKGTFSRKREKGGVPSCRREPEMPPEAVLQMHRVARRQRARLVLRPDLDDIENRSLALALQRGTRLLEPGFAVDDARRDTAGLRHLGDLDAMARMAHLHAGLAEMAVIDDDDGEVLRPCDRDGREAAE